MKMPTQDIADVLETTPQTIRNWHKEGMPKSGRDEWESLDVLKWWAKNKAPYKADNQDKIDLKYEQARRARAQADREEIARDLDQGHVVSRAQNEQLMTDIGKITMTALMGLPSKISPQLLMISDKIEMERILEKYIRDALMSLAELAGPITGNPDTDLQLPDSPQFLTWEDKHKEAIDRYNAELERNERQYAALMAKKGRPIISIEKRKLLYQKAPGDTLAKRQIPGR